LSRVLKVHRTAVCDERVIMPEPLRIQAGMSVQDTAEAEAQMLQQKIEQTLWDAEKTRLQAKEEAARIVAEAKEESDLLVQEARERASQLIEDEKMRGYQEGYQSGREDARKEYASILSQARDVVRQAYDERKNIIQQSESLIVELAISIAEKIIRKKWEEDRSYVLSIVKEACDYIQNAKRVEIRVHPEDYPLVKQEQDQINQSCLHTSEWIVIPDLHVQAGGCVIHTEKGTVDARLDTQLNELKNALREAAGVCTNDEQTGSVQECHQADENDTF
jgi:flagellar assembly protein FliH